MNWIKWKPECKFCYVIGVCSMIVYAFMFDISYTAGSFLISLIIYDIGSYWIQKFMDGKYELD